MSTDIDRALSAGIDYLIKKQHADGHWEDFRDDPIGVGNGGWITAYIGLALTEMGLHTGKFSENATRAAHYLQKVRPYTPGWGFNAKAGPDSDSTAHALLFLQALGQEVQDADVEWMLSRWQKKGGGFATYPKRNPWGNAWGWGAAHPDVTPAAFAALPKHYQQRKQWSFSLTSGVSRSSWAEKFMDYSLRNRRADGTWPTYWWRTTHYSTYWHLDVLKKLGWNERVGPPVITGEDSQKIHSAFDLSFVLGIALFGEDKKIAAQYGNELVSLQSADGSWPGGKNLRGVSRDVYPGDKPKGPFTGPDTELTTASAVRMLAKLDRKLKSNA
jgi:hypothetical protein